MTATIKYEGNYRCEATHLQSASTIQTDAPTDNRGKGERFSPTDLLCVSLGTCIITTMAIRAGDMGIDLSETKMEVTKNMLPDPRRVGGIDIILHLPKDKSISEKDRKILQGAGDNCPVQKSLNPEMKVNVQYNWD